MHKRNAVGYVAHAAYRDVERMLEEYVTEVGASPATLAANPVTVRTMTDASRAPWHIPGAHEALVICGIPVMNDDAVPEGVVMARFPA